MEVSYSFVPRTYLNTHPEGVKKKMLDVSNSSLHMNIIYTHRHTHTHILTHTHTQVKKNNNN